MDNPELVDQMNDQLNTNATVDPAFLINLLKDAQSNKSENYTQMWLSAIDSMDMIANASVKILKVRLCAKRPLQLRLDRARVPILQHW